MFNRRAIFLDRDGTLIKAIHRPNFPEDSLDKKEITAPFKESELEFAPDAKEALALMRGLGLLPVMVTNQPDVTHGYMTEEEWQKIQNTVVKSLGIEHVYMCRHTSSEGCDRRKPSPKMLFDAADNLGINLSESYMIGDMEVDIRAGRAAGCGVILLDKFYNKNVGAHIRVSGLMMAVQTIILAESLE